MRSYTVTSTEAGQRFDKFLKKYLDRAPSSFLYRMLRKKNIVLNGKKSIGSEKLEVGDEIKFFLAEDTITSFQGQKAAFDDLPDYPLDIIFENKDLLIINKPVGMLSQKAKNEDRSLNEYMIAYLLRSGAISREGLVSFRPSVCNRLDRNTSGMVLAGKSIKGLQLMGDLLQKRDLGKYYLCLVSGVMKDAGYVSGYLRKDKKTNKVTIRQEAIENSEKIETSYEPLGNNGRISLLCVHLITGKSHQIRAHLSSLGHPIVGDHKYGNRKVNEYFEKQYYLKHQLLHAWKLTFPDFEGMFPDLAGRNVYAPLPDKFREIVIKEGMEGFLNNG